MRYYSTNHTTPPTTFKDAVIHGLAPDGGLFMPEFIPSLPPNFFTQLPDLSLPEIAYRVAQPFVDDEIPDDVLKRIADDVFQFDIPLVAIQPGVHLLELFHGPTCAFKDVGARFMSRVLSYFLRDEARPVYVLVATSGDTGSAVAQGFYRVPNVNVIILYPSGKVSPVQEMQFTTLNENITALEVDGTFDDCQRLVKQAFADQELRRRLYLTSANSINIARLLPQAFYYFYGYAQLRRQTDAPVVFSVPSGNYGNLTAGLLAQRMGLPVHHFIAASNANDTVPQYLTRGLFEPKPSVATISNAMDVGNPSNFARMQALYANATPAMPQSITGFRVDDARTKAVMRDVFHTHGYLLDPHSAVGYFALRQYQEKNSPTAGIILGTAHPAKFGDVVYEATSVHPPLPPQLAEYLGKPKKSQRIAHKYTDFKNFLNNIT